MAEGSVGSSLRQKRYGGQFLKYEKELVPLCEGDVLEVLILRVFLVELEQRRAAYEVINAKGALKGKKAKTPEPQEIWIEMSWLHLIRKLYLETFISEDTIKAHVLKIVKRGHLKMRSNSGRANEFLLNLPGMQQEIDAQPDSPFIPPTDYLLPPSDATSGPTDPPKIPGGESSDPPKVSGGGIFGGYPPESSGGTHAQTPR